MSAWKLTWVVIGILRIDQYMAAQRRKWYMVLNFLQLKILKVWQEFVSNPCMDGSLVCSLHSSHFQLIHWAVLCEMFKEYCFHNLTPHLNFSTTLFLTVLLCSLVWMTVYSLVLSNKPLCCISTEINRWTVFTNLDWTLFRGNRVKWVEWDNTSLCFIWKTF